MKEKVNAFFNLAQLLMTLAGFLLLISTVLFIQEKEFALRWAEESIEKDKAEQRGEDIYIVTFDGRTLSEQSYYYNRFRNRTFVVGIIMVDLSLLCWIIGALLATSQS